MTDDVRADAFVPALAASPWLPHLNAVPGEILASDASPTTGLFSLDDVTFLYHRLVDAPDTVWAYSAVTGAEVAALLAAYPDALPGVVDAALQSRTLTMATVYQDRITARDVVRAGEDSPLTTAATFITAMQAASGSDTADQ